MTTTTPAAPTTATDRAERWLRDRAAEALADVGGTGRLPTERAIVAATGTSRVQVREVITRLVADGTIEVRGVGGGRGLYARRPLTVTRNLLDGVLYEFDRAIGATEVGSDVGLFEGETGLDPGQVQVTWRYATVPAPAPVADLLHVEQGAPLLQRTFVHRLRTPAPAPTGLTSSGPDVPVGEAAAAWGVPARVVAELGRQPWAVDQSRPGIIPALRDTPAGPVLDRAAFEAVAFHGGEPVVSVPVVAAWAQVNERSVMRWITEQTPGRTAMPAPVTRRPRLLWRVADISGWLDDMLATPHQVSTSWMPATTAAACGLVDEGSERAGRGTIAQLLDGGFTPRLARFRISGRAARADERDALGLPPFAPVMLLWRDLYPDVDRTDPPLEVSRRVVVADTGEWHVDTVLDPPTKRRTRRAGAGR